MQILLYAFSSFGNNHTNISEQALQSIPDRPNLVKHVFPTRFNQTQFLKVVEQVKPDLIIGLGQYPRGQKLRIETIAHNQWRSKSHPTTSKINPVGEEQIITTCPLHSTSETIISEDAGKFVCNYSMYIMGTWATAHNAKFAFLHIPKTFSLSAATQYLQAELLLCFETLEWNNPAT